MILAALGSNLPSPYGPPRDTLEAALKALEQRQIRVIRRSRWFLTKAVTPDEQPDFVNGVVRLETGLGPAALLAAFKGVEADFGRPVRRKLAPRPLDLDLLDHEGLVTPAVPPGRKAARGGSLQLPHPGLNARAFVLLPLVEVAPGWRHPVTGQTADDLIAALPAKDIEYVRPLEQAPIHRTSSSYVYG